MRHATYDVVEMNTVVIHFSELTLHESFVGRQSRGYRACLPTIRYTRAVHRERCLRYNI